MDGGYYKGGVEMVTNIQNGKNYYTSELNLWQFKQISGVLLTVRIMVNGRNILNESYVTTDNEVALYGLGEMLNNYIELKDPSESPANRVSETMLVTLMAVDSSGSTSILINVYYSRRIMSGERTKNILLTHETDIMTATGRSEYISYIQQTSTTAKVMAAVRKGSQIKYLQALSFPAVAKTNATVTRDVSPDVVAKGASVTVDNLIYYDVCLSDGSSVTDKVRYTNDIRHIPYFYQFLFLDAWGMPATMTTTGVAELNPELQGDIVMMLDRYRRTSAVFEDILTVNSGYLNKQSYDRLVDMITSPYLYIKEGGKWIPAVVTDIDFTHKRTLNQKISVQFTIQKSSRIPMTFDRSANMRQRIFDKSFDITFE